MRKRSGKSVKFYLKLMRNPGTPESVGRGVAAGLFSAFIIPAGHMPLAFALAMLVRGARGASLLSTWIVNPLTVSVIYPVQCYIGSFLIGDLLSYPEIKNLVLDAMTNPSLKTAGTLGGELIVSFLVGGMLLGVLAAISGYFCTIVMVRRYRAQKARRKTARMDCRKTTEDC